MRVPLAMVAMIASGLFFQTSLAAADGSPSRAAATGIGPLLTAEFIYETAPFPQCHASTLAETKSGLVAAWFGGKHEKNPDVGIWVSRQVDGKWTAPVEVANGVQDGQRYPCWNPVLHQQDQGPLLLFYKVGPSPSKWWGMLRTSPDAGRTWSEASRLPRGLLGPIKNKPVPLDDGRLLCPSSTEDQGWRVHLEWTPDGGQTWERTAALNDPAHLQPIQPSILRLRDGRLQIVCRSQGVGRISQAFSQDAGRTWTELSSTQLPNPNSGIDAATLRDGRHILVYNHTASGRSPLNVAISEDGQKWLAAAVLENTPGEYSYPAVIQTQDGLVHITYTWKRQRVKHVVLDPARFTLQPIQNGAWPKP